MAMFGEEIEGRAAVALGLARKGPPGGQVLELFLELAMIAARDPELTRNAVRSIRQELAPPEMASKAAMGLERPTQMWSQWRRRLA